ncbi:hypothetical protein KAW65_01800, partial [candidate division WOR-3 bacterium]|nr:hypothetical protein [candidate division WOR-3 bacterium]
MVKRIYRLLLGGIVILSFFFPQRLLNAKTQSPLHPSKVFELKNMDINNVELPITNYGVYGQNAAGTAGAIWPKGSGCAYIFGAGMWIGAIVEGEKRVTQGYNPLNGWSEFMPGPPEHNADHAANASSHPEDRLLFSTEPADTAVWPLIRIDTVNAHIETTKVYLSDQDVYCEYNDMWQEQHEETSPL